MSRLRVILRDRAVLVTLGANLELLDLQLGSDEAAAELDAVPGFAVSQAGRELTRALERHALAHDAADSLQKLLIRWRKTRRSDPILEAVGASRPGPRVFVDRVGSNLADLSWEVLAPDVAGGFFEVALFGYAPRAAVSASASPRLRQLGSFRVPGNSAARGHRLTRLQPQRWYRVQVRSVGPRKRWVSQWSAEVPFRTLSTSAAKEQGLHVSSSGFLVKSERMVHLCVAGEVDGLAPRDRLRAQNVRDSLGLSVGDATTDLLNARYCQKGWPDFVRGGLKVSRPAAQREERVRRMKLALAATELYGEKLPAQNAWFQGPFYYEEIGMRHLSTEA